MRSSKDIKPVLPSEIEFKLMAIIITGVTDRDELELLWQHWQSHVAAYPDPGDDMVDLESAGQAAGDAIRLRRKGVGA